MQLLIFFTLRAISCIVVFLSVVLSAFKSRASRACYSHVKHYNDLLPARENWYQPPFVFVSTLRCA